MFRFLGGRPAPLHTEIDRVQYISPLGRGSVSALRRCYRSPGMHFALPVPAGLRHAGRQTFDGASDCIAPETQTLAGQRGEASVRDLVVLLDLS